MLELLRCGALNFQYALHTTQEEEQPLSESSLRRFRRKVEEYNEANGCDLIKEEFQRISKKMAVDMGVLWDDPSKGDGEGRAIIVRMDSMEIEAHAKAMSRLEILYMTNMVMIRYLLKKDFKNIIPEEMAHYLDKEDRNRVTYHRGKEDKAADKKDTRIEEAVKEMALLKSAVEKNFTQEFLSEVPEYQTLARVFEEQTKPGESGNRIPKENKEISASSVQNPFDETATYRYKNGQHHGFVVNVAEAIDGEGNGVITHADVDQNTRQDSSMAEDYVEQQPDGGPKQELTLDGGYGSDRLEELAASKNIDIQPTALSGAQPYDIDADFALNEDKTAVLSCPRGKKPVSNKYNPKTGMIIATMPGKCCKNCPHRKNGECNVFKNKPGTVFKVHITAKMHDRARLARHFTTEEGKANARRRNGVEGIMSVMRRKYGIDHLPVFGLVRVKQWIWTTLLAYNLVKYQKYQNAKKVSEAA